ncbi:MAG: hypothetical protein H6668_01610 [Ardenticatenaceae bacterium]|nr:hypothetical protein [Ardenticatenaceae bacterium]
MIVETYVGIVQDGQICLPEMELLPEGSRVYVVVPKEPGDLIDATLARRKANRWLLEYVGNLTMADDVQLVQYHQRAVWQFGIFLTRRGHQPIGPIGNVAVDAETGLVLVSQEKIEEIISRGEAVARAAFSAES